MSLGLVYIVNTVYHMSFLKQFVFLVSGNNEYLQANLARKLL